MSLLPTILVLANAINASHACDGKKSEMDDAAIVQEYAQCKIGDGRLRQLCKQLVAQQRYSLLRAIGRSALPNSHYAVEAVVKNGTCVEGIRYCRSLVPGSLAWSRGVNSLPSTDKQAVLKYLREVVATDKPEIRVACYLYCANKKWPELLSFAIKDRDSTAVTLTPNSSIYTLGGWANYYLSQFDNQGHSPR